ncbi:MAG: helicase-related protein [Fibrobacter sp.]|nr:helicase-related protein [Fibrobacter sp.]MDY6391117.1 helicase-related protein [Fibrobacter sp.]
MDQLFINNTTVKVVDDLSKTIIPGSKLSIAAASFSLYAFEALKNELWKIDSLRFIFTSKTFVKKQSLKESREFDISHSVREQALVEEQSARERSLFGSEFELKLRNQLNQKAIAVECAEWIRQKVQFRANVSDLNFQSFFHVQQSEDDALYTPFDEFSAVGLGVEKGNNISNFCMRMSAPLSIEYVNKFNECWLNEENFENVTQAVMDSIASVYKENSPDFIYFVTLYNIFHEFLNDISEDVLPNSATGFKESTIWKKLYNFQKDAALAIINKLEKYNGCILADSVGLGKTFTALAVVKYYENRNKNVLVLCPKKLNNNWTTFKNNQTNNPLVTDRFRYDVLFHSDLSRSSGSTNGLDLSRIIWSNYDLVVIDESHNFRNGGTVTGEDFEDDEIEDLDRKENRYQRLLNQVIRKGVKTKVLMLSATPVNNRFNDLKNQLRLAYEDDSEKMDSLLNLNNGIDSIFKQAQSAYNAWTKLPASMRTTQALLDTLNFDFFELLDSVTIARSRKHIEKFYDINEVGKFPERLPPISESPNLTDVAGISFDSIYLLLSQLQMSVYSPARFVHPSKMDCYTVSSEEKELLLGRETGIRKLMSINMLKRLESSVYSFQLTLGRYHELVQNMVDKIHKYMQNVAAGKVNSADANVDYDIESVIADDDEFSVGKDVHFSLADMDYVGWLNELNQELDVLAQLKRIAETLSPEHDTKLQTLFARICDKIERPINSNNKKVIVFTAFADTAKYLYEQLAEKLKEKYGIYTALVTGDMDGRTNLPKLKADFDTMLTYFSPVSKERHLLRNVVPGNIDLLIATDCISEGQNLQDCDYLINYDIHWNPVRIIQRFGRIDRIGSKNAKIQLVNFWPNVSLDEYINLKARVVARMKISVMTATGDDNPISAEEKGDLEYRKEQLRKLKEDVVDLEDMKGGVNIVDLGLNDFRMDLLQYRETHQEIENAPTGIYALVKADEDGELPPGVIYILRNRNHAVNIRSKNRLHPFYMVYLRQDGSVVCNHLSPKKILDLMRHACRGLSAPNPTLCRAFNKETADGRKMGKYSDLLQQAIASIIEVKEESDIDSLFGEGETTALTGEIRGLDDFELVTFLVVK